MSDGISDESVVVAFLQSWKGRDIDYIMSFFDEHAVYHNVPVAPITGHVGIRQVFQSFLDAFPLAALDIVNIVGRTGLVFAERIDRFTTSAGRNVVLPVNGVFVLEAGKIKRFSDYFDLASFENQSGLKL
jgi:limonene-1,2-epoxide hydrolase